MSYKKRPRWPKYCTPLCNQFRCTKRALGKVIYRGNRKYRECLFIEGEICTGKDCNYAYCLKKSFRTDGKCGQWVAMHSKSKTYDDDDLDEENEYYDDVSEDLLVKKFKKKYPGLREKALKKLKYEDYDDF